MKKESIYLPSLNSLFLQHKHFQNHRKNVENCRSAYDNYRSDLNIQNSREGTSPKEVVLLKNEGSECSSFRNIKETKLGRYYSCEPSEREGINLSPFQKRKLSQRDRENGRIYGVLQQSHSLYGRDRKDEKEYYALKERIRKYIKEGRSVKYKFKKSLVEIEKRKQSQGQLLPVRSMSVEEARGILQIVKPHQKHQNNQNHPKPKDCSQRDIYIQTIRSVSRFEKLLVKTEPSNQVGKGEAYQSIVMIRQRQRNKSTRRERLETDPERADELKSSGSTNNGYMLQCVEKLRIKKKQKLANLQMVQGRVGMGVRRSRQLNDLEIVSMTPVVHGLKVKTENV